MNQQKCFEENTNDRVSDENRFVESLRQIWLPHQRSELEVRYKMGVLLNNKLGQPTVRQSYGMETIKRVSEELSIDKSDISRMRRFADKYDSFEEFRNKEPGATCWTHVRSLVAESKTTNRPTDRRTSWGVKRSLKSLVKALGPDHDFNDSETDEIRQSLCELFELAKVKFKINFV